MKSFNLTEVLFYCAFASIIGILISFSIGSYLAASSIETVLTGIQIQQVTIQFNETMIADVINKSIAQTQYETRLQYEKVNP